MEGTKAYLFDCEPSVECTGFLSEPQFTGSLRALTAAQFIQKLRHGSFAHHGGVHQIVKYVSSPDDKNVQRIMARKDEWLTVIWICGCTLVGAQIGSTAMLLSRRTWNIVDGPHSQPQCRCPSPLPSFSKMDAIPRPAKFDVPAQIRPQEQSNFARILRHIFHQEEATAGYASTLECFTYFQRRHDYVY
jgi:hypothetical protein